MIRISERQLHHLMARLSERAMTVLRFLAHSNASPPPATSPGCSDPTTPAQPQPYAKPAA